VILLENDQLMMDTNMPPKMITMVDKININFALR